MYGVRNMGMGRKGKIESVTDKIYKMDIKLTIR